MPTQPKKKRRLVKGKDYDRWMFQYGDGHWGACQYDTKTQALLVRPLPTWKLVKVKLVEVK